MSAKALDRQRCFPLIFAGNLVPFFSIKPRRDFCRTDKVRKQHSEISSLADRARQFSWNICRRASATTSFSVATDSGVAISVIPHSIQNFAVGGLSRPQSVQRRCNGAPHWGQKFAPAAVSPWQVWQRTLVYPG